mgnify:CR=1 FL=1|jgi:hypothetical protein
MGQPELKQRTGTLAAFLLWLWILTIFAVYMQNYVDPIRLMFRALLG